MSNKTDGKKILGLDLEHDQVGTFNYMINWNFNADDIDYYSPYEDNYGTKSSGSGSGIYNFCDHEWIDVGFFHPKFVCKKCDKDKE